MKKVIVLILSFLLMSISFPLNAFAEDEYFFYEGLLRYKIVDGEVTIVIWSASPQTTGELVIPSEIDGYPVTTIGVRAFANWDGIDSVIIPENVTTIREGAFANCSALTRVELPNSLTTIESNAFLNCKSLADIILPDKLSSIGAYTFDECTALSTLKIPASLTDIGYMAFGDPPSCIIRCYEGTVAYGYYKDYDYCSVINDVSGDGTVDANDLIAIKKQLLSVEEISIEADCNESGSFDILDFIYFKKHLCKAV